MGKPYPSRNVPIDSAEEAEIQRMREASFAAEVPDLVVEILSSAFAVYTAIATAFSSSLISFLKPRPLGAFAKMCCKFSHVGASFQLALLRQDEILSPQEIPESDPRLVPSQCF